MLSQDNVTVDERLEDNFTVRLQSEPTDNVTLVLTVSDDNESSVSPATLSFSPDNWSVAQTVVVSGVADRFVDGSQTSTLTVASDNSTSDNKYDGLSASLKVTTQDNDTAVVTIDNVSALENTGTATMTLRLTNGVSDNFTVYVSTSDGTAYEDEGDYTALSSVPVSFAGTDNETQTVSIILLNDGYVEDNETLTLKMVSVSNSAVVITDTGTLTIVDDDVASVTIADVSVSESASSADVTLVLDKYFSPGSFTVRVFTTDGTAKSPGDYTAVSETVTFSGYTSENKTVSISLSSDPLVEGDETIIVSMDSASYGVVDISDNATVTIEDDDFATLTIASGADVTLDEGDNTTVTLSLDTALKSSFTVVVSTVDGSATAGEDYTAVSQTVTFSSWQTSKTISISSTEDSIAEDNETFVLRLDNTSSSSVIITDNATVTIL